MNIKSNLKKYNISHRDIANAFGYSSDISFNNSSRKVNILNGVSTIITLVENNIRERI